MRLTQAVWAFAAGLIALPQALHAHGLLRSSYPAARSVLSESPHEVRLTFTEAPERTFTRVRLFGQRGEIVLAAFETLPGNVVLARNSTRLEPGEYRVEWQTAGDDGHPVSGSFTFTVAEPGTPVANDSNSGIALSSTGRDLHPRASSQAPGMADPAPPDPFAAVGAILRWLTLMAAIAAIGAVAFRFTVLARVSLEVDRDIATDYLPRALRGAAGAGAVAAAVLVLTSIARLLMQSLAVHGPENMLAPSMLVPMIAETNWGTAWAVQLAGAAIVLTALVTSARSRRQAWWLAAAGCLLIAVGLAVASHAAVVPRLSAASVVANTIHTVSAAGWLGNLLLIFAVGLPLAWRLDRNDRWTVVRDIVNAFSPAALSFGVLAGATGVFMAWTHVGSFAALAGTDYGRVLLLKIGLLSLTAITGAYNWLRVRPSLGDHTAARRLRRTAGTELAIATLVIAVTAVLVALPIPQSR